MVVVGKSLSNAWVYLEVCLLSSLKLTCALTHSVGEGEGSMPSNTAVEPSAGVVGIIQQNTEEGGCPVDNPSEMLTKASFF